MKVKRLTCWKIDPGAKLKPVKYGIGINGPHIIVQCESYKEAQFITKALNDRIKMENLNPYTWKKDKEPSK